jgi:hypothetical protein
VAVLVQIQIVRHRAKPKRERGQSFVELALILPLLVLLLVGLVETAFFARTYLIVLEASRESARLGARGAANFDNDEIRTLVEQHLSREGYDSGLKDVIIVRADVGPGKVLNDYVAVSMLGSRQSVRLTKSTLLSRLDPSDPRGRLIGVEIYYDHQPALGFPLISDLFPDPTTVHTYSIMRLLQ